MDINVYIKEVGDLVWTDISDYVIQDLEAFVNLRERDYTLISRGMDLILTDTYPNTYTDIDLVQLRVSDGVDTIYVNYMVSKYDRNKGNHTYKLTCEHWISKLKNYELTYTNIHSELVAGTTDNDDYDLSDYYGYPNVAIWYLFDRMLDIAGMTLDIGTTQKQTVVLNDKEISWDGTTLTSNVDVKLYQIKIDENMLYSLNQDEVGSPPNPSSPYADYDYSKVITFYDFISWFSSMFSLDWYSSSTGYGFVVRTSDDYVRTVSDSQTYGYTKIQVLKQKSRVDWQILAHENRALYATSTSSTALKDVYYEPSYDPNENWYNNLLFMITDPADDTKPAPLGRFLISTVDIKNYITPEDVLSGSLNIGFRVDDAQTNNYEIERINTVLFSERQSTLKQNILLGLTKQMTKIERII